MSHGTAMGSIMFLNVTTEKDSRDDRPGSREATTWPPLRYASTHFAGCPVICAVERALRLNKSELALTTTLSCPRRSPDLVATLKSLQRSLERDPGPI